ncbi:uncharacterized protein LOC141768176 [Sebastes fasciatus]|uniref:uncharacterized protein LOC141768176 n=1 Tax=Sebastes fasciatus TaxID=394691 RepID=UPI003D9E2425
MASNGPPVEEDGLLTRIRRWIASFASGSFWPLHNERPDVERPPDDPVLPDYEDEDEEEVGLVWGDDADGLQEAEAEPQGGNGDGEQQVPPPYFGLGWRQGPAAPFPVYYPVYYPVPYLLPYAFPPADPYGPPPANPFANLQADLPADYYGFPADPFIGPPADPYGRPPTFPPAYPFGDFQVDPHADPHGLPHSFPSADPHGGFEAIEYFEAVEYFVERHAFWQHGEDEDHLEDHLEDWDDGDNGIEFPILEVEDIGPVCQYNPPEELSEADSGPGPSTRRHREDSDGEEEAAAKRPRWSDDSDSD